MGYGIPGRDGVGTGGGGEFFRRRHRRRRRRRRPLVTPVAGCPWLPVAACVAARGCLAPTRVESGVNGEINTLRRARHQPIGVRGPILNIR